MPISEVDLGSNRELMFEYTLRGERVAAIRMHKLKRKGRMFWVVRGVNVLAGHRRKGIATKLYAHAAKAACAGRGAPLASDERVGEGGSEGFWQKQLKKGRATVLCKTCGPGKQPVYTLDCPAPASLRGARKRKR